MKEEEKLKLRLQNTEKALLALFTVIEGLQPPQTQESISIILNDYFDANASLGFKYAATFESNDELSLTQ